ncbi:efflux RND transporter periplasmic adaptor subunit [Variovorax sp. H27-G14]|uniref:efflux RND transporter periplasmic adaptor subunit n=1 Tax=Variovorax sp. H27-G14 TaxID=3111914 RepID=UPI0038FC2598
MRLARHLLRMAVRATCGGMVLAACAGMAQAAPPAMAGTPGMPAPATAKAPADAPGASDNRIRTQFAPRNEVVISSELAAKISSLPLREGDAFRAGQTLVAFDCSLFQAQLGKARATLDTAKQTLVVQTRLAELNSTGALELQQAQGRVNEGTAEVAYSQATVSRCTIRAPFNGRVAKRQAATYQYVTPGTPLMGLIDTSELELQLIVPSQWLSRLKVGSKFQVQVDELGTQVSARIARLGARIDPVSQTIGVTGVVEGNPAGLLPGMGGWATFAPASPSAPAR